MKNVTLAVAIGLSAHLSALHAQAGEQRIKEGEVPKPVIEAVKRKYSDARMIRFEHETEAGKSVFEIGLEDAGQKMQVELSPEGKILEEELLVDASDPPAVVKKALAGSRYAKWTVKRLERVIVEEKGDAPNYEVLVADGGSSAELVIDSGGSITKEQPKRTADEDED